MHMAKFFWVCALGLLYFVFEAKPSGGQDVVKTSHSTQAGGGGGVNRYNQKEESIGCSC